MEPSERSRFMRELADKYPRARYWFIRNFERFGFKGGRGPVSEFPDPGAERLFAAHDAFVPVGRVLVQRTKKKTKNVAVLSTDEVVAALAVADKDPAYPPNILLRLLAVALSGALASAADHAQSIVKRSLGLPLTQRWAKMVLAKAPPFAAG
jgi:hypothetical protein